MTVDIFGREEIVEFQGINRWLSNFAMVYVEFDGETYPSTEHAYQAAKSLRGDERQWILEAPTPANAKKRSRYINVRTDWVGVRLGVMIDLLRQKYRVEPFKSLLLATGDKHLEEGNTWGDKFWGTVNREGENWLGQLTMQVRTELREEDVQTNATSSS